jgi:hypothetical protein
MQEDVHPEHRDWWHRSMVHATVEHPTTGPSTKREATVKHWSCDCHRHCGRHVHDHHGHDCCRSCHCRCCSSSCYCFCWCTRGRLEPPEEHQIWWLVGSSKQCSLRCALGLGIPRRLLAKNEFVGFNESRKLGGGGRGRGSIVLMTLNLGFRPRMSWWTSARS